MKEYQHCLVEVLFKKSCSQYQENKECLFRWSGLIFFWCSFIIHAFLCTWICFRIEITHAQDLLERNSCTWILLLKKMYINYIKLNIHLYTVKHFVLHWTNFYFCSSCNQEDGENFYTMVILLEPWTGTISNHNFVLVEP